MLLIDANVILLYALRVYAETTLDFVDCLLVGYGRVLGREVFTFDKKLKRLLTIDEK